MKMDKTLALDKSAFLAEIKKKGLSSPAGIHWDGLRKYILKHADNHDGDKLLNPLILGASMASHSVKHERLSSQLDWAEKHGSLKQALMYLQALSEDKWNQSSGNDWGGRLLLVRSI